MELVLAQHTGRINIEELVPIDGKRLRFKGPLEELFVKSVMSRTIPYRTLRVQRPLHTQVYVVLPPYAH